MPATVLSFPERPRMDATMRLRLPDGLSDRLHAYAARNSVAVSAVVRLAAEQFLARQDRSMADELAATIERAASMPTRIEG